MISVTNLAKQFKSTDKPAVDNASFKVGEGEFVFLGSNLVRKTTTVSILLSFEYELLLYLRRYKMADVNLIVSSNVKKILPDAMIEYLWKLVLHKEWRTSESQSFVLEVGKLSGQNVQDIFHVYNFDSSIEKHRVFGLEPVNCKLQIWKSQNGYQMSLSEN